MRTHELKCWPEPFAAVLEGRKRYEIRFDDRGFAVGDELYLREYEPEGTMESPQGYTGRAIRVRVTYISHGQTWGLHTNRSVLSIVPVSEGG